MSSDYLKQLQLTKQLEQRAKALVKEHRDTEARLADAKRSVGTSKEASIDVSAAEATLSEASQAFSQRDNAATLVLVDKCIGQLNDAKLSRLRSAIDDARNLVEMFGGNAELEERFEQVLSMSGRLDKALTAADAVGESARQFAAERFERRAARADSLRQYAVTIGLQSDITSDDIEAARGRMPEDAEAAWSDLSKYIEDLMAPFCILFDEGRRNMDELISNAALAGVSLDQLTILLDEGEEALRTDDAERALELLHQAEKESSNVLSNAVADRISALKGESLDVAEKGGDLRLFKAEVRMSEEASAEEALEPLRRAGDALQQARASVLMDAIGRLRSRLILSKKLDLDLSPASALLDEARELLENRDLNGSLLKTAEARDVLDAGLRGHFALAEELQRTRDLFMTVRKLQLPLGPASSMVSESRRYALSGQVEEARTLLAGAGERLREALLDAGSRRALAGLANLSEAIAVGAWVNSEKKRLLEALDGFQRGDINEAVSELGDIASLLRDASTAAAADMVGRAVERVCSSTAVDLSDLSPGLEDARRMLENGELIGAVVLAEELEVKAIARQCDASTALSIRAAERLKLSRTLGCASATIEQKMERAKHCSDPATSSVMFADIIHYTTQLIRDELTASLAHLTRDIAAARRNGVSVDNVGKLSEDVARKLLSDEVDGCHEAIEEARGKLERSVFNHTELYDRIASLSRAIGQAGLPPKNPAQAKLDGTKRLFEAGKYDGARVSANACLEELERLAAETLVPDRLEEGREIMALLEDLSINVPSVDVLMRRAEDDVRSGHHAEALSTLKEMDKAASNAVRKELSERIDEVSATLRHCSELGCDIRSASDIMDRAASLLKESRYHDALRAVRFADSESERLLALFRSVQSNIGQAELSLEEADELGLQVPEAVTLLDRAREELRTGKHSLALERSRMVHEIGRRAVAARIEELLNDMEGQRSELEGDDLREYGIDRDEVMKAAERNPRWGMRALARYEYALKEVEILRDRASKALGSLPTNGVMRASRGAKEAFERGGFSKCLALLAPAIAEEPLINVLGARRRAVLADLRKDVSEFADIDAASLLEEMENANAQRFWELHSEVLDALEMRYLELRRERVGGLIDSLRALDMLTPDSMSAPAKQLLSRPLSMLSDDDLHLVEELRSEARDAVVKEIGCIRSRTDVMDASLTAIAETEMLLKDGSLTLAARAVQEANLARGWTAEERKDLWKECSELMRRVSVLEGLGGDISEAREKLQKALVSSPDRSRDAMADAWSLVMEEEYLLFPAIRLEVLQALPSKDEWERMSVALVNEGGIAVGLRPGAEGGEVRAVLPDALSLGRRRIEIEVRGDPTIWLFYRPLLSAKEESSPALIW